MSGKQKVPIAAVAEDLTGIVLKAASKQQMSQAFQPEGSGIELTEQIRIEWIALNMFMMTKATQDAVDSKTVSRKLLDTFHALTYRGAFDNEQQRVALETLLNERYTTYFEILKSSPTPAEALAHEFSKKVPSVDYLLVMIVVKFAFDNYKIARDHLAKVSSQFELVDVEFSSQSGKPSGSSCVVVFLALLGSALAIGVILIALGV